MILKLVWKYEGGEVWFEMVLLPVGGGGGAKIWRVDLLTDTIKTFYQNWFGILARDFLDGYYYNDGYLYNVMFFSNKKVRET